MKFGSTIFADYTYNESPTTTDADGNTIHNSSFNVTRAYINVFGTLNHLIAYRITPDITRETGIGSSLAGSYTFRLKYAFGQLNLDDWTTKGSWAPVRLQQTPWIDYAEGIYRYRFQGPTFVDRESFFPSSDSGVSGHWNFPETTVTFTPASTTARATARRKRTTRRRSRFAARFGRCLSADRSKGCA